MKELMLFLAAADLDAGVLQSYMERDNRSAALSS
jgi:hypothetical protein